MVQELVDVLQGIVDVESFWRFHYPVRVEKTKVLN